MYGRRCTLFVIFPFSFCHYWHFLIHLDGQILKHVKMITDVISLLAQDVFGKPIAFGVKISKVGFLKDDFVSMNPQIIHQFTFTLNRFWWLCSWLFKRFPIFIMWRKKRRRKYSTKAPSKRSKRSFSSIDAYFRVSNNRTVLNKLTRGIISQLKTIIKFKTVVPQLPGVPIVIWGSWKSRLTKTRTRG